MKPTLIFALTVTLLSGCSLSTNTTFNKPYADEEHKTKVTKAQKAYDQVMDEPNETVVVPEQPMLIQPIGTGISAELISVESADTLRMTIPQWPEPFSFGLPVRIAGAAFPKIDGACQAEINAARATKAYLTELLAHGHLQLKKPVREQDFAIRATVTINSVDLSELLLQQQLAKRAGYGNWCN